VIGFDQPNTPPSARRTPVVDSATKPPDSIFSNNAVYGNTTSGNSTSNLREFDDNEEAESMHLFFRLHFVINYFPSEYRFLLSV
jgi:hypothetical protein